MAETKVTYSGLRPDDAVPFKGLMRETTTDGSLVLAYYDGGGVWVDSRDLIRHHYDGADNLTHEEAADVMAALDNKWRKRRR